MFEPGQKIICVDDQNWPAEFAAYTRNKPVKNAIYTVRAIERLDGIVGILLVEIRNARLYFATHRGDRLLEPRFNPKRFAPCRKTDISVFTAMLDRANRRANA